MILILLQLFPGQIDAAVQAYNNGQDQKAYNIAFSIPLDSVGDDFEYYEVLELRGLMSKRLRKFEQAKQIYNEVIQCEFDSILYKAYINFADVHYYTFDFNKRIGYLQKAYHLKPTPKVIRNIARHHFQIRADYETAQVWIDRHPTDVGIEDRAGFALLQAEFNESKRQYSQAIDYYSEAKIRAKEANLFNYELFAAEGVHRVQSLLDRERQYIFDYIGISLILLLIMIIVYKYADIEHFPQTPD